MERKNKTVWYKESMARVWCDFVSFFSYIRMWEQKQKIGEITWLRAAIDCAYKFMYTTLMVSLKLFAVTFSCEQCDKRHLSSRCRHFDEHGMKNDNAYNCEISTARFHVIRIWYTGDDGKSNSKIITYEYQMKKKSKIKPKRTKKKNRKSLVRNTNDWRRVYASCHKKSYTFLIFASAWDTNDEKYSG